MLLAIMYTVYLLRCSDGTFYTGITTNLARRLQEHNTSKRGAAYTKSRRPVTLFYEEIQPNRSQALQREYVLRKMSHLDKQKLGHGNI